MPHSMSSTCFVLALCLPSLLPALSLQDLFTGALNRDRSLSVLEQEDRIRETGYEKEDLKQKFDSSLSTGDTGWQRTVESGETKNSFLTSPGASMTLPYPWGTSFSLEAPISYTDGENYSVGGKLEISQPLNELLGLTRDESVKDRNRRLDEYLSAWSRYKARKALEQEVLKLLKEISVSRKSILEKEGEILKKRIELETALRFDGVGNGTRADLSLRMELNKLKREKLQLEQNLEEWRQRLSYRTGASPELFPDLPDFRPPRLPEAEDRSQAPAVRTEILRREIREEEARQSRIDDPAELKLGGTLQSTAEKETGSELSPDLEKAGLSLTRIGTTMDIKGGLNVTGDGVTLTGALTWKQPDRSADRLDQRSKALELKKQNLLIEKAWLNHLETEERLKRQIGDLELRYNNILEDIQVSDQALKEQDFSWRKGYISDSERDQGLLARRVMDHERTLLILESLDLQREIEKYYFTPLEEN